MGGWPCAGDRPSTFEKVVDIRDMFCAEPVACSQLLADMIKEPSVFDRKDCTLDTKMFLWS